MTWKDFYFLKGDEGENEFGADLLKPDRNGAPTVWHALNILAGVQALTLK